MKLRNTAVLVSLVLVLTLLLILFQGCRKERPGFERNLPPETFLTSVPLDSSFVFYRVKLYWGGLDPDGQVAGYYYAVVDSNLVPADTSWIWTTETEKEFSLLANNPEMLGHRFFCRAVDTRGLPDPTPAFVFFYARDFNLPKITYTQSYAVTPNAETIFLNAATVKQLTDSIPGDTIPTNSVLHFSWRGWDSDPGGYVTGYLYRLSTDAQYKGGSLADTSCSYSVTRAGFLNFEVVATDDAGAMSRRDSLRYFVVNNDPDTWIIPPCDTCCSGKKGKGFMEGGSIPRCEGDTLRLSAPITVSFVWDGWDKDGSVGAWTYRLLTDGGGLAYSVTFNKTWQTVLSESHRYDFLARARDNEGKDDGTPATVGFYTNCAPFFIGEQRCCGCSNGIPATCSMPCTNALIVLDGWVYDSVYCAACDVETPAELMAYRFTLNGKQGSWKLAAPVAILTKAEGLIGADADHPAGQWNTLLIEARDKQPDNSPGRIVSTTREFFVDVTIP